MFRVERYFEITSRFFKAIKSFVRIAAGFVVLLFLLCSGGTASAAGFPEAIYVTASTAGEAVKGVAEHLLFRFVLKRSYDDFIALHDLTAAYIAETDDLIRAMYRTDGRVGAVSFERMPGELTVDQGGGVRLLYGGDNNGPASDAAIDLSGFKEYVEEYLLLSARRTARVPASGFGFFRGRVSRGSVGLFLFDRRKLTSATLFGNPDIIGTITPPKHVYGRPSAGFNTRGLLWSAPMDRAGSDIILVALYPYRLRGAVYTFGLIAIIILTILLLWLIITCTTAYYRTRGVRPMSEKEKSPDIINEIDQELTGGENNKHPEETGAGKDVAAGKAPEKQLEEDGIFIGK